MQVTNTLTKVRKLQLLSPVATLNLNLPAMPVEILYSPFPGVSTSVEGQGKERAVRIRDERRRPFLEANREPLALRNTFLGLRNVEEAANFFLHVGHFQMPKETFSESVITGADLYLWQEVIGSICVQGWLKEEPLLRTIKGKKQIAGVQFAVPGAWRDLLNASSTKEQRWLAGHIDEFSIAVSNPRPDERPTLRATIHAYSVLETILAVTYAERLCGIKRALCSFPDCNTYYEVRSKHPRQYCSEECGHKALMRKRRSEQRAERRK